MELMKIPSVIREKIDGKSYRQEDIGRSGSAVLMFDDMVLKIEKTCAAADNEYAILSWLDGKLQAPRVIAFARDGGYNYLLMTRLSGVMACEAGQDPAAVVRGLARGLQALWTVDISDCPLLWDVDTKLASAKERMATLSGKPEDAAFSDYASLYAFLSENRPKEELVFSHGDYCLPNVFLSGEEPCGFLDLGCAGIADKWYDIHMCLWSLRYNFCELGGMSEDDFAAYKTSFFEALSLEPNEEKLRYHALLDEFFM